SEFNVIKDLLRSALKTQPNIDNIMLSGDGNWNLSLNKFSFNSMTDVSDVVIYDLDSMEKEPRWKLDRMFDALLNIQIAKHGMSSLVVISSEHQLKLLQREVNFIEGFVITKPFTFKQVAQVVNNIWTSNLTS
uniref:response regulator n=1 Tax=Aeromonas sp. HMWF016 TaxID=2056852 RepID=UPI0015E809A9